MRPLLAYIGDDFTGSTDVMEVMQWAGYRTLLFLDVPTPKQLESFGDVQAFGVATRSRCWSPSEMENELGPILKKLSHLHPKFLHYKVCSTGDSAPHIGSIGKAMELGKEICGTHPIPVLIPSPRLGRYQVFGNLFARFGEAGEVFRIDRHPSMQNHPITPMLESDMRLHLRQQTTLPMGLIDAIEIASRPPGEWDRSMPIQILDLASDAQLASIGDYLNQLADACSTCFVVGSSAIENALLESERRKKIREDIDQPRGPSTDLQPCRSVLVVSGSCSPVSAKQVAWAIEHGFEEIAIDTAKLIDPTQADREVERLVQQSLSCLEQGRSVIMHSAMGPSDARISQTLGESIDSPSSNQDHRQQATRCLGAQMGRVAGAICSKFPIQRMGVAGGDTSSYIAKALGIVALEAIAPITPGAPLCRAYRDSGLPEIEVTFKGGQIGRESFWEGLLNGLP